VRQNARGLATRAYLLSHGKSKDKRRQRHFLIRTVEDHLGGVALAAPAHAQGFWFGIGPFGFGVGQPHTLTHMNRTGEGHTSMNRQ
jgi:hypothetical protein